MTNKYSLADLRADLDKQYAPFVLDLGDDDEVVLRNVLRLPEKERTKVLTSVEELDVDTETQNAQDVEKAMGVLKTIIETVAADGNGERVTAAIGDDLMVGMRIFELWMEATQPGEASNSPA